MNWTHIVAESYCLYNEKNKIPKCCKFKPNHIGLHCFEFDNENKQYCPFLALGTAKSTIILTGSDGELKTFDTFENDEVVDENEWRLKEEEWINKWKDKINNGK